MNGACSLPKMSQRWVAISWSLAKSAEQLNISTEVDICWHPWHFIYKASLSKCSTRLTSLPDSSRLQPNTTEGRNAYLAQSPLMQWKHFLLKAISRKSKIEIRYSRRYFIRNDLHSSDPNLNVLLKWGFCEPDSSEHVVVLQILDPFFFRWVAQLQTSSPVSSRRYWCHMVLQLVVKLRGPAEVLHFTRSLITNRRLMPSFGSWKTRRQIQLSNWIRWACS